MSSCLSGGGGRTYGLDIAKPSSSTSSSSAARSCHSASPSSTLTESSNSPPRTISIKKARAPRKRPNQTYNEAAALLSTAYPTIFSVNSLKKLPRKPAPFDPSFPKLPELLPPFPVLSNAAAFLIRDPPPPDDPATSAAICIKLKPASPVTKSCESPVSIVSAEQPNSPAATAASFDDDFDAESILDEEVGESIDSIMGNLSMTAVATASNAGNTVELNNQGLHINSYIRGLIGLTSAGGAGKFGLGLRFRQGRNLQQALRHRDESDWWRIPAVPMPVPVPTPAKGNAPQFKPSLDKKKKKKKKKVEKIETNDLQTNATKSIDTTSSKDGSKSGLGLRLNHEEVIKSWTGRGSMFSDGNSSADALARLADIDLSPEAGGAAGGWVREASVQRYKEKRLSRLFSKKIRYQVRKVNADQRPRMKASGRFVRRPSLLLQLAIEEECQ